MPVLASEAVMQRHFLGILGGAASSWPAAFRAHAQPAEVPVIGYLDASGVPRLFEAFRHGLSELGYVRGRTIMIEQRSAAGQTWTIAGFGAGAREPATESN